MTPEEIKQRMDEMDTKLRAELARHGFKPDEIERQLDRSIPDDVKQAEREKILARHFVEQVNDPSTGLMDAIISRAADQLEKELEPELLAKRKRERRTKLIVGGVVGAAAIGLGVWYVALRDTRTSCEKLVGPVAELEKLTGEQLAMNSGHETKYSCYQYVDRRGHAGGFVVNIDTERGNLDYERQRLAARKFTEQKTFATDVGEAVLFVAGDDTKVSTEQLQADIYSRVGKTSDPTGAALAALPPAQHVALLRAPSGTMIRLSMDREVFTVDKAMTYAREVAKRAK